MEHIFTINRTLYDNATMGEMLNNGKHFGFTLEDVVHEGYEYGKTAIPAGRYRLIMTMSNRFHKVMPQVVNTNGANIQFGNRPIQDCGIRIHGGNTTDETLGCPLLGMVQDVPSRRISQCAYPNIDLCDILNKAHNAGETVFLDVVNLEDKRTKNIA